MSDWVSLFAGLVLGATATGVTILWKVTKMYGDARQICALIGGFCTGLTTAGNECLLVQLDGEPTTIPLRELARAFAEGKLLSRQPVAVERPAVPPPYPEDTDGRA